MYIFLGQPQHTPAPPTGIVLPRPTPTPAPPGSTPAPLAAMPMTRVSNIQLPPFPYICRIVARPYDRGGKSIGTGILISPYHVLTCAHCIYPPEAPNTKEIVVFPGQNGPDHGCPVRANGWSISPGWRVKDCHTAGEDYGIIRLACPTNPGFFPLRPFDPSQLVSANASLAGYPYGRDPEARHMYFSRGSITGAIHIQHCTGNAARGTADGRLLPRISESTSLIAHDLETAPSQSGSPMWIVVPDGRVLIALHSGRIDRNTRGKAVLLNESVRRNVADWMTRTLPPI
jgi:V8-like Glu-specific endopeptidase